MSAFAGLERIGVHMCALTAISLFGGVLGAQACPQPNNGTLRITSPPASTSVPTGTTSIRVTSAGVTSVLSSPGAAGWTPTANDVTQLAAAQAGGTTQVAYVDNAARTICTRDFIVDPAAPPPVTTATPSTGGRATTREFGSSDCVKAGALWETELARQPGTHGRRFTELVFMEATTGGDGSLCYYNRDYGVVGDPIYVGVFSANEATWTGARFEPCAVQSAAPNVLQSTDKFPSLTQSGGVWQLYTFLERRCYNTSVEVSIVGRARNESVAQRYPLSQYDRYRATLQAGVLFSTLHQADFALRSDQADTSRHLIYDRGPTNRGPEYIAALQLYSVLRYLRALGGEPYPGRDPIHDQGLLDRVGGVMGVAITNPTRRFVAGVSVELLYGISATWLTDFAQVNVLPDDLSLTTPFKGTVDDIPVIRKWEQRGTLGITMDLRYFSLLFTGNR
jgi:hypothetical protein